MSLSSDIDHVLISTEELKVIVSRLGKEITRDYADAENLLVIGALRGAAIFMTDLVRQIDYPLTMDFLTVSSYGSQTVSSGEVHILNDLSSSVEGQNILLVEDIIDTGNTLHYLKQVFEDRGAASVKICALLNKPMRREIKELKGDYIGQEVPDEFVVGYGLDYMQKYRNLPYIGVLKESVYQN